MSLDEANENLPVMFLRLPQVKAITGMSRSWIYDAIHRRVFPAPISLGRRAVAWDSRAIADWQAAQIEASAKRHEVLTCPLPAYQ